MKQKLLLKTMLLLFALIAGSSSAWADTGTLVTALNGITSGDTYYITALNSSKYYTVPNTTISGQTFTCTEGTFSESILTPASGAGEFVFTAVPEVDNAFYIYNTNLGMYLVATASKTFGYVASSSTDYGYWTFSTVSSGGFSGQFSVKHSDKSQYIRAYNNSVRCYDSASNNGVYLFKKNASNKVVTPSINGETTFLTSTEVSINCVTGGASIQYSINGGVTWTAYSVPFSITETTTVQAKATKTDMTDSNVASKTFTKITPITVAEARAAIDAASGTENVYVRGIVCEGGSSLSSGAMNYWISDDGTETDKFEIYKGKGLNGANFTSTDDVKVGDIVVVYGNITKYESTYEFSTGSQIAIHSPKVLTPTFSPAAGAVAAGTNVTISTATADATIYYTVDGTDPTTESSVYSTPITINAAKTIKAFAVKDGYPNSEIATAAYTIATPCATPTFLPAAGEVEKGSTVTISCGTDGATIYYTTNGTDPTTSSSVYSSAITINSSMTIKAIAAKEGYANSAVATAAYTVRDYAILPLDFDGGKGDLPSGMTHSGLGSDYGSSPKLKFDNTGDYLILKINEVPDILSFKIKGNSFSQGSTSTFTIQTSVDGSSYTDLDSYTTLNEDTKSYKLDETVRYIKWIYTEKGATNGGNVALGNIKLFAPVTISSYGWATYTSPCAVDFTGLDVKAYAVEGHSGSSLTLSSALTAVPANTPLLLNGAEGSYAIPVAASASAVGTNLLKKGTGAAISKEDGKTKYVLGVEGGKATFLKIDGTAATVPTDKAYLEFDEEIAAPMLSFDGEGTTGIKVIDNGQLTIDNYYNLAGQRVAQPTKGLYIVNGKKVVIK
jgi:hypothetical protein